MQRQLRALGVTLAAALMIGTASAHAQVLVDPVASFNANVVSMRQELQLADVQAGRVEAVALRLRRGVIPVRRANVRMRHHLAALRRTIATLDRHAMLLQRQVHPDRYSEAQALGEFLTNVRFIEQQSDRLLGHVRANRGYEAWYLADQMQHRLRTGNVLLDRLVRHIDRADLRPTVRYRY